MARQGHVIGIDLGTTNSEVAAFHDGQVRIIGKGNTRMLPSCVGLSPEGELLIGEPARNQLLLFPERTVRSIKRMMGRETTVRLGDKDYTPQEISAIILRELADWARAGLGGPVDQAVITVPAYFSDAQRQATREAGALAGLEVVRILNEPTAASLAYGVGEEGNHTVLVYDLGGGTFDVSIVTIEDDVTEVLGSHGNNHLGGDDFDQLIVDRLVDSFKQTHGIDPREGHAAAYSRIWRAAEEAKKRLSGEPFTMIREEALITRDGTPLHLEMELSREEYQEMIRPLIETTLESVSKAMSDAGKKNRDLDAVLLVGGATRTPLVMEILEKRTGIAPKQDVHPDLCVALGAGVMASRMSGREIDRVLVDVSPFSFGISYLGNRDGLPYYHCYHPIIRRNTPLPVTKTEAYETTHPFQTEVDVHVYQGDDPDALKNIPVGDFKVEGLQDVEDPNVVLCRMNLDLDGILNVTAIEKDTGLSKNITINNSLQPKSDEEIAAARRRLDELFADRVLAFEEDEDEGLDDDEAEDQSLETDDPAWEEAVRSAEALLDRSRGLLGEMHDEDREEAIDLHERIEEAIRSGQAEPLDDSLAELRELLFFVEGK